ncbi:AzlD family protein [Halopiger djelfimassiliensis]|uniref:AzlD family protein n=1 Tax=Halopiger djelfimassiliensis TaxID=1293047 RepID=UPI0006780AC7|nr:AzlD domain-containing protein [Halopiger djelfimassiliensis]
MVETTVLLAIAGMAIVTYLTRVGGFWLVDRVELSDRSRSFLGYVPGAVLVSLILPELVRGGVPEFGAALVTLLVAIRTGNILYAMAAGIGAVVAFRRLPLLV